ncbi:hypothetical protein MRB53_021031 [Persea americana]|uniref:Uncharacterized protein n=1 Tax=Persea americana TaxID=3435 RepID=A0ACC2L2R4_PERAE|nr:hypothetical protein MRB53_021031 [Persea americana]
MFGSKWNQTELRPENLLHLSTRVRDSFLFCFEAYAEEPRKSRQVGLDLLHVFLPTATNEKEKKEKNRSSSRLGCQESSHLRVTCIEDCVFLQARVVFRRNIYSM